jgi:hypothetical protein
MDPRLAKLEVLRARKADSAQAAMLRARRNFFHAAHLVTVMTQKRVAAEKAGAAQTKAELDAMIDQIGAVSDVMGIHEAAERRRLALQLMDTEIARATAEREKLRQIALEQQRRFHDARKLAKKLEVLVDTLRTGEKSLQTRLAESRSDSAVKDTITGQWKLLQTDQ